MKKKLDKYKLILSSAVKVFARKGFFLARTKDIAQEADVSEGSIYNYFSSKDSLLIAIFQSIWEELIPRLHREIVELDDPDEQMALVLDTILDLFSTNPDLAKVFLIELKRSGEAYKGKVVELMEDTLALLREIVERGVQKGMYRSDLDLNIVSVILYGAVEGILTAWLLQKQSDGVCRSDEGDWVKKEFDLVVARESLMDAYLRMVR